MTTFADSKILLIGAGKMGGALRAAWVRAGKPSETIQTVDINAPDGTTNIFTSLDQVKVIPDCIVIAVKPQSMDTLLPDLKKKFGEKPLYLSIAAGKTLTYFAAALGAAPMVRAMPNTPAIIGEGVTAFCANEKVTGEQKKLAEGLFNAAGETLWLDDEAQMDAVTAVSGSGPAYVFLFLESLIAAGKAQGLPEAIAVQLALATVQGSLALAKHSNEPLSTLRKNVTSAGGTTEAALKVLMAEKGLSALMNEAITAAAKRSKELA